MRVMHSLGCGGAIRAIALCITPHSLPRQGRRRPTPRFYAKATTV
jgi:hypothetical protein